MKIVENAISDELNHVCVEKIREMVQNSVWTGSHFTWEMNLVKGIPASCLSSNQIDSEIQEWILTEVMQHCPSEGGVSIHFNVWQPLTALNWHDDADYTFGATIYLNEEWDIDNGGIFLYQEKEDEGTNHIKALVPKKNTMVINDKKEFHAVTPVAYEIKEPRLSIQIFGIGDKYLKNHA